MPVEIWRIDLEYGLAGLFTLEADFGFLSADDRERVTHMVDRAAADRRLAAVIALRLLLGRLENRHARRAPFERNRHGKPTLPGSAWHFSLSHSATTALVGLSDQPVGIDIEHPREPHIDGDRRQRIEAAAEMIADGAALSEELRGTLRFLQAWTRLEALAKADGRGIGWLLTEIGVLGVGRSGLSSIWTPPPSLAGLLVQYETRDVEVGCGAIAAVTSTRPLGVGRVQHLPRDFEGLKSLLKSGC